MDVAAWLRGLGLEQYAQLFRDNDIDGEILCGMTAEDLKELGISSFGHRRRLLNAITALGRGLVTGAKPRGSVEFFVCPGSDEYDSLMTCPRPPIRPVCHVPSWKLWW